MKLTNTHDPAACKTVITIEIADQDFMAVKFNKRERAVVKKGLQSGRVSLILGSLAVMASKLEAAANQAVNEGRAVIIKKK